jgi:hypothetical protein
MTMNLSLNKSVSMRLLLLGMFILGQGIAAQDYGLTLRSLPVFANGEPFEIEYTGTAIPWFAAPLGEQGDVYLSGGISAEYSDEEWKPVPDVYRFEIAWRFGSGLNIKAGRLPYQDPFNLVMNGFFDGLTLGFDLGKTRLSAEAFYTGLLYKKTAYITMNPGDYADYYDQNVYFASRRLVFSLDWEIPAIFDTDGKLNFGIIGQFDLNKLDNQIDEDAKIHSQYALAGFTLPFLNNFKTELGSLLGIIEEDGLSPGLCFVLSGNLVWLPPGAVNDRLSLGTVFSSGSWNDTVRAFLPINTRARGNVLRPNISGLALVEGSYTVRLHQSLSASFQTGYFFRTDSRTYNDPDIDETSLSPFLGGEVYGGLTWAPVSDIAFTLGGGAFFPRWGKTFTADTSPRWRVSLETILSF